MNQSMSQGNRGRGVHVSCSVRLAVCTALCHPHCWSYMGSKLATCVFVSVAISRPPSGVTLIMWELNSGIACRHSFRNLLYSHILSKSRILKYTELRGTSVTLIEGYKLGFWRQGAEERKLFGLRMEEITRGGENCVVRSVIICTLHLILWRPNQVDGIKNALDRAEICHHVGWKTGAI
jgi:hypothetical protein